nr:putative transposase En/Spm [Ipomoea batatas]
MKNKRYVEGSIADAYMLEESTHFASFYFDDDVQSRRTRIGRNLNDGDIDPNLPITLSIFNRPGRSMGRRKTRYLSAEERFTAHQYVLLNCEEVPPILSQNSDLERTISASPSNVPSLPTSPSNRPTVRPIGNKSFEPWRANRDVIECVTKIFLDAMKSYKDARRHMKDVWFNEFRKSYKWNLEDEATIQSLFHKKAARRLSDTLGQVRKSLPKGDAQPKWMTGKVLAQYRSIWDTEEFRKTVEKNKRLQEDCLTRWDHRCTLQEVVTQKQQTQPELRNSNAWYEAAGGIKKGGYVFGFGSDTPHYFPDVVSQKNSKSEQSSSHVASGSHESSGVGLDDFEFNDGMQSPMQEQ